MSSRIMKMLISGGNGFLGSHIVKKAISNGIDVTVVDDMSTMNTDNLGGRGKLDQKED